jgi:type I restriction enzyme S subunit
MLDPATCRLEDLASPEKAAMATGPFGSAVSSKHFVSNGVPMLRGSNLSEDVGTRLISTGLVFLPPELADSFARSTARAGDLVFTCWGTVGQIGYVENRIGYDRYIVSNKQMKFTPDITKVDPLFLYYYLSQPTMVDLVKSQAIGSTIPGFNLGQLRALPVSLPELSAQHAIAEVLGALDDKIAANTKLIMLLDATMALSLTKAISAGRRAVALGDVVAFHNRRRIPLSSRERDSRPGSIPYFGASGPFGTVDVAIFDEPLVLVGEDGSVINPDGTPVVQYIWGPAWVNNHAHVLTGVAISTELLYFAIAREQVATLVTGAVQPKINMGNLKRLELTIPAGDGLREVEQIIDAQTASKRLIVEEIRTLTETRDALHPQLMSGKLRVRDAEKALAGVL